MVRAQPRQFGEGRERDVVGHILLDIGGHPLLLPGRKATTIDRLAACSATVDANEFVRQHDAERLGIEPGFSTCDLNLRAVSRRSRSQTNRLGLNSISPNRSAGSVRGPRGSI